MRVVTISGTFIKKEKKKKTSLNEHWKINLLPILCWNLFCTVIEGYFWKILIFNLFLKKNSNWKYLRILIPYIPAYYKTSFGQEPAGAQISTPIFQKFKISSLLILVNFEL